MDDVPGLENVNVTDRPSGRLDYRSFMPTVMYQLGFPVTITYFDKEEVSLVSSSYLHPSFSCHCFSSPSRLMKRAAHYADRLV